LLATTRLNGGDGNDILTGGFFLVSAEIDTLTNCFREQTCLFWDAIQVFYDDRNQELAAGTKTTLWCLTSTQ